jgi:hypothetical protein
MVKKKYKKKVMGMVETSMIGSAGSIALGGIGGTSAHHGQAGIQSATSFMGVTGSMVGTGMLMDSVKKLSPKKKKKKRRKKK